MVEAAAENDDTLMEKFFEEGALSEDDMRAGIRAGLVTRGMFPVFCVCAGRDMCVRRTLEFLGNVVPCTDKMPRLITTEGVEVTPTRMVLLACSSSRLPWNLILVRFPILK